MSLNPLVERGGFCVLDVVWQEYFKQDKYYCY